MSKTSKRASRAEKTAKQGDALKAALKMPPRKHKDEPKRRSVRKSKKPRE